MHYVLTHGWASQAWIGDCSIDLNLKISTKNIAFLPLKSSGWHAGWPSKWINILFQLNNFPRIQKYFTGVNFMFLIDNSQNCQVFQLPDSKIITGLSTGDLRSSSFFCPCFFSWFSCSFFFMLLLLGNALRSLGCLLFLVDHHNIQLISQHLTHTILPSSPKHIWWCLPFGLQGLTRWQEHTRGL